MVRIFGIGVCSLRSSVFKFEYQQTKCFPHICSTFCYNFTQISVYKHAPTFSSISFHSESLSNTKRLIITDFYIYMLFLICL